MGEYSPADINFKVKSHIRSEPNKKLAQPITELSPISDLTHIERHWQKKELGSDFIDNDFFHNAQDLNALLENATKELISPDDMNFNRHHAITIEFQDAIGYEGILKLDKEDKPALVTRDAGTSSEAEVLAVPRLFKKRTNLLTFIARPVFPPKGTKGAPVRFQLATAYPGEYAAPLITNNRIQRHETHTTSTDETFIEDQKFWQEHAFIVEDKIPGRWYREHNIPLPAFAELKFAETGGQQFYISTDKKELLLVNDENGNIVAQIDFLHYDSINPDDSKFDHEVIQRHITAHMAELGIPNCTSEILHVSDDNYDSFGLNRLEAFNLESLTGKPDSNYLKIEE